MSDSLLEFASVSKWYGPVIAVNDVSLGLAPGITGLVGPNGAGKTTSFYMIVGMIKPNEGKIFLDDEDITENSMYKRAQKGVGYLAQEASVFRKLSVEDNIMSILEFTNLSKADQKTKLEELLKEFSASGKKNLREFLSEKLGKELIERVFDPYNLISLGYDSK